MLATRDIRTDLIIIIIIIILYISGEESLLHTGPRSKIVYLLF